MFLKVLADAGERDGQAIEAKKFDDLGKRTSRRAQFEDVSMECPKGRQMRSGFDAFEIFGRFHGMTGR